MKTIQSIFVSYINDWNRTVLDAQPLYVGSQLQGLLVLAVPDAGVHQLRQLEDLQQLSVALERQRVQTTRRVDVAGSVDELFAFLRQIWEFADQSVQLLFRVLELLENVFGTLGSLDKRFVVRNGQVLSVLDDGFVFFGQSVSLLAELVDLKRSQLVKVVVNGRI